MSERRVITNVRPGPRMTSTKHGQSRVQIPATATLRSISTRLMLLTASLILALVLIILWQWTTTARRSLLQERENAAVGQASTLAASMMNEIDDANWSQIRVFTSVLEEDNKSIVYVAIHSGTGNKIVAASPEELNEQYIPDLVPLAVTTAAVAAPPADVHDHSHDRRSSQTFLLRDVIFGSGDKQQVRGRRGERIVEVTSVIRNASDTPLGYARVGITLSAVDEAVRAVYFKAVTIGALALLLGLLGAWFVARRLSRPIRHLAADAAKIAGGNLAHRVDISRRDEIGALATAFNNMTIDLEDSFGRLHQTVRSFERFVPSKFLAVIAPEGVENIVVGTAATRRMSVLFTDLRGFTSISEDLNPLELFDLLNDYLARMGSEIVAAGGFVDKYIGDAIMALFDDEHTDSVLRAIIGMRTALAAMNAERVAAGKPPIEAGIGAHGGSVVMGTIGFANKIESTVIGDAVNVASRVESMTKEHGVSILVTSEIVDRLFDKSAFPLELVAKAVTVRGRDEPIDLYTLRNESPDASLNRRSRRNLDDDRRDD
ncbi:MAG TPA: adenylate/guanylate cyclase domain-containing protein [Kofleriaceae bacterium]